jgi:hypothetical protein
MMASRMRIMEGIKRFIYAYPHNRQKVYGCADVVEGAMPCEVDAGG